MLLRQVREQLAGWETGLIETARDAGASRADLAHPLGVASRQAAVNRLRAGGFDVRDDDVARLSPFVRHHIDMHGRYSFQLPHLPGGLRPLRDRDATDQE